MTTFSSTKGKLNFSWNTAKEIDGVVSKELLVSRKLTEELGLANRSSHSFNSIVDLSTDFQPFQGNFATKEYFINYQIIFDRINIKWLNNLNSHFVYLRGGSDSPTHIEVPLSSSGVTTDLKINEAMQVIDLSNSPSDLIKKVIWNKSVYRKGQVYNLEEYQIKLVVQISNPQTLI